MWNHNFDYVSEGNCTFIVVQQCSGSDHRQIEAAVMFFFFFFFFAKKTLSTCIQSLLFLSILMCVGIVLFFQGHALCHVKVILACTVLRKILADPNNM